MKKLSCVEEIPGWPEYWFSYSSMALDYPNEYVLCVQHKTPQGGGILCGWIIKSFNHQNQKNETDPFVDACMSAIEIIGDRSVERRNLPPDRDDQHDSH